MADIAASSSSESTIELNNDEIRILKSIKESLKAEAGSFQSEYNIYRVPTRLHKLKPEAYTPQSISIGPLHSKDEHLQTMQAYKLRYLNHLLDRRPNGKTLDDFVKAVNRVEEEARKCYSESIGLGKDEFVKMMVIDGCFILEFIHILRYFEKDHFVSNYSWRWEVISDLIKLENQLPLFVRQHLHSLIFDLSPQYTFSDHISVWLLRDFAEGLHGPTTLTDQVSKKLSPIFPKEGPKHFLDLLRCALLPSSPRPTPKDCERKIYTPCASELKSGGVKFQKSTISPLEGQGSSTPDSQPCNGQQGVFWVKWSFCYLTSCFVDHQMTREQSRSRVLGSRGSGSLPETDEDPPKTSLFDIAFDKKKGVLTIPTISIYDETEVVLRNLIAFEQGLKDDSTDYFTSYTAFMDGLIDTVKDVELLEKNGIIKNHLGNPEDVVSLFNNIGKYVTVKDPYFSPVIKDVEEYHNKTWNKWRASLMDNYFNSPWALISFLAAVFLLILTIVQTICSVLQVS